MAVIDIRYLVRNDNIKKRETESREHHREVQESKTEAVWTREETSEDTH